MHNLIGKMNNLYSSYGQSKLSHHRACSIAEAWECFSDVSEGETGVVSEPPWGSTEQRLHVLSALDDNEEGPYEHNQRGQTYYDCPVCVCVGGGYLIQCCIAKKKSIIIIIIAYVALFRHHLNSVILISPLCVLKRSNWARNENINGRMILKAVMMTGDNSPSSDIAPLVDYRDEKEQYN